ncbi:hypothetical protein AAZV13_03G101750 [Glycine max]
MRVRSSIGRIDVVGPSGDVNQEITALEFDEDGGFLMVVGSSAGKTLCTISLSLLNVEKISNIFISFFIGVLQVRLQI